MIALVQDLKNLVNQEMKSAYLHGFKSAAAEDRVKAPARFVPRIGYI